MDNYKDINFYIDEHYGPDDMTVFYSDRDPEGDSGVFTVQLQPGTNRLEFMRVRTSFSHFKRGIEQGVYRPIKYEDMIKRSRSKTASKLEKVVEESQNSKKPVVFLGGTVKGKPWRPEVIKEFKDRFFFIDPVDKNWKADDNIYDETAGIVNADYVVFYEGGEGTEKEKDFIDLIDKDYEEFDNIEELKKYLDDISKPVNYKRHSISSYLFKVASDLLIDQMKTADDMSGTVHTESEKRIKLKKLPEECEGIKPIIIKQGVLKEVKKDGDVITYARVRMKKDPGKDPVYSLGVKNFPLKQEAETEISKQMFDSFYPHNLKKPQEKERYSLSNGWDVDKISDGKIVAEFEREKGKLGKIPDHWEIIKDTKKMASGESYSSLQIQIPSSISKKMIEYGKKIPDEEIYNEPGFGREKDSHITVLYGLHCEEPDSIKEILSQFSYFEVKLGDIFAFLSNSSYDPLIIKVYSPELHRLNGFLRDTCDHTSTYPDNNPHATIAYLKKGNAVKYFFDRLEGDNSFIAKDLVFSSKNGKRYPIKLK